MASKWSELGIMLGVPLYIVEAIEKDCLRDSNTALTKLIQFWLNNGKASWEDLARALGDIGNRKLAQSIREALRKG